MEQKASPWFLAVALPAEWFRRFVKADGTNSSSLEVFSNLYRGMRVLQLLKWTGGLKVILSKKPATVSKILWDLLCQNQGWIKCRDKGAWLATKAASRSVNHWNGIDDSPLVRRQWGDSWKGIISSLTYSFSPLDAQILHWANVQLLGVIFFIIKSKEESDLNGQLFRICREIWAVTFVIYLRVHGIWFHQRFKYMCFQRLESVQNKSKNYTLGSISQRVQHLWRKSSIYAW